MLVRKNENVSVNLVFEINQRGLNGFIEIIRSFYI